MRAGKLRDKRKGESEGAEVDGEESVDAHGATERV